MSKFSRLLCLIALSTAFATQSPGAPPNAPELHFKSDLGVQPTAFGSLHVYEGVRPVHAETANYPNQERLARIMGTVILAVLVAEDGSVADVRVKQGSGNAHLDAAALEVMRRWKFPALKTPARYVNIQTYEFDLDG